MAIVIETDIREKTDISHCDIATLNFIKTSTPVSFRKHFRQGLRSHIIEVLDEAAVQKEVEGVVHNRLVTYPVAKPMKMLRIFKIKLSGPEMALGEIEKFKVTARYLAPDHIAQSDEFIVDYYFNGQYQIILCGLQDFVAGEIIDPWQKLDEIHLKSIFANFRPDRFGCGESRQAQISFDQWYQRLCLNVGAFIAKIKTMIEKDRYVPDLSGVGNLIVTPAGAMKLVDINNISPVDFKAPVRLDDKGYPACDKSIEVLAQLEQKILKKEISANNPIYRFYLTSERMAEVSAIESIFLRKLSNNAGIVPPTF